MLQATERETQFSYDQSCVITKGVYMLWQIQKILWGAMNHQGVFFHGKCIFTTLKAEKSSKLG